MLWTIGNNSRITKSREDGQGSGGLTTGVTLEQGKDSVGRGQPWHSHPMPGASGEW